MLESVGDIFVRIEEIQRRFGISEKAPGTFDSKLETANSSKDDGRNVESINGIVSEVSKKYSIPETLIKSMIKTESDYDPDAVSKKGAMGLMQLMPETAEELGVDDAFDPYKNIDGGVRYLKTLLGKFNGDLSLALAAYNAGPDIVEKQGVPDFSETKQYINKVIQGIKR